MGYISEPCVAKFGHWILRRRCHVLRHNRRANTGTKTGACVKIETALKKNLLNITCHHYIAELVLEKVFALHDSAKSLNVDLFVNFCSRWPSIGQTKFKTILDDPNALEQLSGMRDASITFATKQLATNQPRSEYRVA